MGGILSAGTRRGYGDFLHVGADWMLTARRRKWAAPDNPRPRCPDVESWPARVMQARRLTIIVHIAPTKLADAVMEDSW